MSHKHPWCDRQTPRNDTPAPRPAGGFPAGGSARFFQRHTGKSVRGEESVQSESDIRQNHVKRLSSDPTINPESGLSTSFFIFFLRGLQACAGRDSMVGRSFYFVALAMASVKKRRVENGAEQPLVEGVLAHRGEVVLVFFVPGGVIGWLGCDERIGILHDVPYGGTGGELA